MSYRFSLWRRNIIFRCSDNQCYGMGEFGLQRSYWDCMWLFSCLYHAHLYLYLYSYASVSPKHVSISLQICMIKKQQMCVWEFVEATLWNHHLHPQDKQRKDASGPFAADKVTSWFSFHSLRGASQSVGWWQCESDNSHSHTETESVLLDFN